MDRNPERAVRVVVLRREEEEFGLGEEGGKRVRPLEDSELVGEEAAERNRRERLRREGNEVLEREDRRWEWMLGESTLLVEIMRWIGVVLTKTAQMEDWTAREESWKNFKGKQEKKKGQGMRNFMNGLGARLGR